MNSEFKKLTQELFETKITPAQRKATYWFMKDMDLASQAKAPISLLPKEDVPIADMMQAFEALSRENKLHTIMFIISDIAYQFQEKINLCKDEPDHLDSLKADDLREIASFEHGKATHGLLNSFPKAGDVLVLSSIDYLAEFHKSTEEPTPEQLARLKSSLMDIWIWQAGVKMELPPLSESFQKTIQKVGKIVGKKNKDQTPG